MLPSRLWRLRWALKDEELFGHKEGPYGQKGSSGHRVTVLLRGGLSVPDVAIPEGGREVAWQMW